MARRRYICLESSQHSYGYGARYSTAACLADKRSAERSRAIELTAPGTAFVAVVITIWLIGGLSVLVSRLCETPATSSTAPVSLVSGHRCNPWVVRGTGSLTPRATFSCVRFISVRISSAHRLADLEIFLSWCRGIRWPLGVCKKRIRRRVTYVEAVEIEGVL